MKFFVTELLVGSLGDLGLDVAVLEDGLDDDVATLQVGIVLAGKNPAQDALDALWRCAPLLETALEALRDSRFASLRAREVSVE